MTANTNSCKAIASNLKKSDQCKTRAHTQVGKRWIEDWWQQNSRAWNAQHPTTSDELASI